MSNKEMKVSDAGIDGVDLFQQALEELDAAIKPLEDSVYFNSNFNIVSFLTYLYLLWHEFHIYIIDPFVAEDESGTGGDGVATLIPVSNGYVIFDYGFVLSTSAGENYGSYCQGKLYETIQEMVAILAKRGVKKVSCVGRSDAMRVAWIACVDQNIELDNYEPNYYDLKARERILASREKARKLKPGQIMRLI